MTSTPLSLRRNTGANVAANAGAPGEVVVDTTNNRATVHDGSTLGGFAQAAIADIVGRNTVVNGSFGRQPAHLRLRDRARGRRLCA